MFQKYYKNTVKLSCMNKEKTMTAGSNFKKINKVYKEVQNIYYICASFNFLYNANNEN